MVRVVTKPQVGGGGYLGFQETGMIEWSQKSRPKKFPGTKINPPQKNPMPILLPLKVQ